MRWIKNGCLFCSCWKVAGWSGGASCPGDNRDAGCPNMSKLSRMWFHWAAGQSSKALLSPTPQRGTTPAAGKRHLLSTSPNSGSREKCLQPPSVPLLLKLHPSPSETAIKSTPEPSSVSLRPPAFSPSLPATGWGPMAAGSRWASTWRLSSRSRFSHDRRGDSHCQSGLEYVAVSWGESGLVQLPRIQHPASAGRADGGWCSPLNLLLPFCLSEKERMSL